MARTFVSIHAPVEKVWDALTRPELVKKYFFGTDLDTDWKQGSSLYFRGTWEGKPYEDKGKVLEVRKNQRLAFTYWSNMSGKPDLPENYQTIAYDLRFEGGDTMVTVTQNCPEEERATCESNWTMVLGGLKKLFA